MEPAPVYARRFAQFLFENVKESSDPQEVLFWGEVARLSEVQFEEVGLLGIGRNIDLWADLKSNHLVEPHQPHSIDIEEYGRGIQQDYREVFELPQWAVKGCSWRH